MTSIHTSESTTSDINPQPHSSAHRQQLHQTADTINSSSHSILAAGYYTNPTNNYTAQASSTIQNHTQKPMDQSPLITPLMQLEARIKSLKPIPKIIQFEYAAARSSKPANASGFTERYGQPLKSPIISTSLISSVGLGVGDAPKAMECEVLFFDDSNGYQLKLDHGLEIGVTVNRIYKACGPNKFLEIVSNFRNKFMYLVFGMRGNDKEWKKVHEAFQEDRVSVQSIMFEDGVLKFSLSFIGGFTRIAALHHLNSINKEKEILHERGEQSLHAVTITVPANLKVRPVVGAQKLGRRLYETTVDDGNNAEAISAAPVEVPITKTKKRRRRRGKKAPKALLRDLLSTLHEDKKRVAAGEDQKGFRLHVDFGAEGTQGDHHCDHPSYKDLDIFADELPTPGSWLTKSRRALRKEMASMGEKMARRAERVRISKSGHRLNTSRIQNKRGSIMASKPDPQTVELMARTLHPKNETVAMSVASVTRNPTIPPLSITAQETTQIHPATHLKSPNTQNKASAPTRSPTSVKAEAKKSQNSSTFRLTSPVTCDASSQPGQRTSPPRKANPKLSAKQSCPAVKALDLKSGTPQRIRRDSSTITRVPLAELKNIKLQISPARKTPVKTVKVVEAVKQTSMSPHKTNSFTRHCSTITSATPVSTVTKKIHVNERVAPEATTALLNTLDQELKKPVSSNRKETLAFEKREKTSPATFKNNNPCPISVTKDIQASPRNCQSKVQGESYAEDHLPARPADKTVEKSTSTQRTRNCYNPSSKTPKHREGKSPIQNAPCHTITRQVSMEKRVVVNLVDSREQPGKLRSPTTQHHRHSNTGSSLRGLKYGRSSLGAL